MRVVRLTALNRQDLQFLAEFVEGERRREQDMMEQEATLFSQLRSAASTDGAAGPIDGEGVQVVRVAVREKREIR